MKKIIYLLLVITTAGYSQILEPVKWTTETKKVSDSEYELIINATIEPNYHLYSQKIPDEGPRPTTFIFDKNSNYELIGNTTEGKGHTVYDPIFKMNIKYFDTKVTFKQRVKVKNKNKFKIIGEIEYMTCNDSNCVLGYGDIEFKI
ncbi:protein-disulfide reductase DsbD family protein [Tamlana sp. 2_MG-2023]|uniref:protein-disulfide reductase DsbD domain-containing protein n=1 Tax=unclassified Tamlana TaxID=2614803 RepID=UPI0026E46B62|nr:MULTISPECIES: protein-disulfide reductase DsbD domain-containing protein [unclassified Tamlana]MDO6761748.1 protein-disulfide reductase DsbD family protein [Tamlana sp. 2_MG-2023]MDO6792509.1 protein-disulfide reductase DsbD family protein [Tamlana sp. 1_MG-2023]